MSHRGWLHFKLKTRAGEGEVEEEKKAKRRKKGKERRMEENRETSDITLYGNGI